MIKTDHKKFYEGSAIVLAGRITIKDISGIRENLLRGLAGSDKLTLDLMDLEESDLSLYQLLCSAHVTAHKMNKKIIIKANKTNRADTISSIYGFCTGRGCNGKSTASCVWNSLN